MQENIYIKFLKNQIKLNLSLCIGGIEGVTEAGPVAAAVTLTGFIGLPTVPIPTVGDSY
jgi:hypothetical protein